MIEYIIWSLCITYALYVFYAAVMNIKRVRDAGKLTTFGKVLGYPTLAIGLFLDLLVNVFVMTVILLELPHEFTVTSRLSRHIKGEGWRKAVADWFAPLLNPLDPSGVHLE